jgi:hypothetical protein
MPFPFVRTWRYQKAKSWKRSRSVSGLTVRLLALFGILMAGCDRACAADWELTIPGTSLRLNLGFSDGRQFEAMPHLAASSPGVSPQVRAFRTPAVYEPLMEGEPALSAAARRVSMIAWQNGDRKYLMVDKVRGRIMLFENGRLILVRAALTGTSQADLLPRDSWSKPWFRQKGDDRYKVTPAGRFTLTHSHDRGLGDVFDINELKGRDWIIAIHRVWLGNGAEHRDVRLHSAIDMDKHITDGCVDVDPSTISELLRLIPARDMPVYILPTDDRLIPEVFATRDPLLRLAGPTS